MSNHHLKNRSFVFGGLIIVISTIFISRLAHIQLFSSDWSNYAGRLTEERETLDPMRGQFLDRNGKLLVANIASYDLLFTPRRSKNLDTLKLANLLGLDLSELVKRLDKAAAYSRYVPSVIEKQLTAIEFARISKQLMEYPEIKYKTQSIRSNIAGIAGHLIGEYREVDRDDLKNDNFYHLGDYKGKSGLEAKYEKPLRGEPGARYHIVDVWNNVRNTLDELDTMPHPGKDITLTIDVVLQAYAEKLLNGKRGSVVAIEPETGEVLALVSSPVYDANSLTGKRRGIVYDSLSKHTWKPLYNRALRGTYRPGSIFKMVQGLVALDERVITTKTIIHCDRSIISCHGPHTADDFTQAITHSCNPYFYEVMRRVVQRDRNKNPLVDASMGLENWNKRIKEFGFGTKLGGHIPGTRAGSIPNSPYYDNIYGKNHWGFGTIFSLAIGEGELLTTPLQMANLAAIIANRGYFIEPHPIRDVGGRGKPLGLDSMHEMSVDVKYFKSVIDAMQNVIEDVHGTASKAKVEGITICGKTGTVQNGKLEDHSVFIAFAPRENPQIALSVYVEHAGSGGAWAAPIAGLLIEKYLTDSVKNTAREQRIIEFQP